MDEQSASLPDAATLLNNYAAILLGSFDTSAHRTRYTRHHTDLVPGFTVTVEKFQRAPAELVQKTAALDGSMIVVNGYDGNVAWQLHEGIARIVTGAEADVLKETANLYYTTHCSPCRRRCCTRAAAPRSERCASATKPSMPYRCPG